MIREPSLDWRVTAVNGIDANWYLAAFRDPVEYAERSPRLRAGLGSSRVSLPHSDHGFANCYSPAESVADSLFYRVRGNVRSSYYQKRQKVFNELGQELPQGSWDSPYFVIQSAPASPQPGISINESTGSPFDDEEINCGVFPAVYRWAIGGDSSLLNERIYPDSSRGSDLQRFRASGAIASRQMSFMQGTASLFNSGSVVGLAGPTTPLVSAVAATTLEWAVLRYVSDLIVQRYMDRIHGQYSSYVTVGEILSEIIGNIVSSLQDNVPTLSRVWLQRRPSNRWQVKKYIGSAVPAWGTVYVTPGVYFAATYPCFFGNIGLCGRVNPYMIQGIVEALKLQTTGSDTLDAAIRTLKVYDRTTDPVAPSEIMWFNPTYEETPVEQEWCESVRDLNSFTTGLRSPEEIDQIERTGPVRREGAANPYRDRKTIVTRKEDTQETKSQTVTAGVGLLIGAGLLLAFTRK